MKKVYHLTIEYDSEKDEIEYISEEIDEGDGEIVKLIELDLNDHFDEDIIELLLQYGYFGEA